MSDFVIETTKEDGDRYWCEVWDLATGEVVHQTSSYYTPDGARKEAGEFVRVKRFHESGRSDARFCPDSRTDVCQYGPDGLCTICWRAK